ncbi:LuxR C-terminal-related transcriptional regulator [Mycobacteroides abscessus]|nr:LuxR C-terminal-related transcriptional regulator [Mycobacteroides abscessus]MDM2032854.1 LuxR C-terminal-related transcriptional regulator [Mycobacteroides abscessus]
MRHHQFVKRLSALREQVALATYTDQLPAVDSEAPVRYSELITEISQACAAHLRSRHGSDTETAEQLGRLLLQLQQLAMDWYLFKTSIRNHRLADCSTSLNRLRAFPSTTALINNACDELVFRCGFHRAVLSTADSRGWTPLILLDRTDDAGRSWFSDWKNQTVPLISATPEAVSHSRRRPSLIHNTADAPVYRPLIVQAGHSHSYVVAPLVQGNDVIGFLHADHHPESIRVDESDRDVLWAFADGFSHLYQRATLLEKLRDQRNDFRELFVGAIEQIDDICETAIDLERQPTDEPLTDVGLDNLDKRTADRRAELTERESDVLRLMVTGASNQEIAKQLVITEGTVKSHVKHILRKYGAVNRAQAIAWALQNS